MNILLVLLDLGHKVRTSLEEWIKHGRIGTVPLFLFGQEHGEEISDVLVVS